MKTWMTKALELLRASLEPPKHELNELDWKAALSPDNKRLMAGVVTGKLDIRPVVTKLPELRLCRLCRL